MDVKHEQQQGSGEAGRDRSPNAIDVHEVSVAFGGVRALTDVSASVGAREIVAVIGPNGAGKTTLLNAVCGVVGKSHGEVRHFGRDVTKAHSTKIAQGGLGRSFQDPRLIDAETVLENVLCGAHATIGYSFADQVTRRRKIRRLERAATADALELLDLVSLGKFAHVDAGQLAYGPRKMVDIIRATMARPSVLLLDEPTSGLDLAERAGIERMLLTIHREFAIPMLVVEHHMDLVRAVADRVLGLVSGSVAMEGPTATVLDSDEFRATMTGDLVETKRKVATACLS